MAGLLVPPTGQRQEGREVVETMRPPHRTAAPALRPIATRAGGGATRAAVGPEAGVYAGPVAH